MKIKYNKLGEAEIIINDSVLSVKILDVWGKADLPIARTLIIKNSSKIIYEKTFERVCDCKDIVKRMVDYQSLKV